MSKQGEFLKTVRRKKGLTQKQLAEKLNVSDKVISKWEVGDSFPDYSLLPNLSQILEVEIQEILNGEFSPKENKEENSKVKNKESVNTNNYVFVTNVNAPEHKKSIADEDVLDEALGLKTKTGIKNLQCKSCGSSDIRLEDDYGICNNCGAKIIIDKNITNNFITNVSLKNEKLQSFFTIDTLLNEKEFLKNVYYFLTIKSTPVDVLDNTKFEKIEKKDAQFLEIDANYTGSYSASIGYDRKEQYIDHEKHYDYQLQREVTKEVVKERTVTDWRPISGPVSSYEKSFVQLGVDSNQEMDQISRILSKSLTNKIDDLNSKGHVKPIDIKKSNINFLVPTANEIDNAILSAESNISYDMRMSLAGTGDHVKDFNCNLSHIIDQKKQYIVPEYSVNYVYHDSKEEKDIKGFSLELGYKSGVAGIYPDATEDIKNDIKNKTKGTARFSLWSSIISILSCIISMAFIRVSSICIPLVIILGALSLGSFIYYSNKYKGVNKQVKTDIFEFKKQKLIERLKEEELPPLTSEELNSLNKIKEDIE